MRKMKGKSHLSPSRRRALRWKNVQRRVGGAVGAPTSPAGDLGPPELVSSSARFCNVVQGQLLESVHGGMAYTRPISLHMPENLEDRRFSQ